MLQYVIAASLFVGALGSLCPNPQTVANFDANRYMGTWYEVGRFGNPYELLVKCPKAQYTLNQDGTVGVNNTGVNIITKHQNGWQATASVMSSGKLIVTGKLPVIGTTVVSPYWVLGTDYDNFSVVWSCFQQDFSIFSTHIESGWILSRSRNAFSNETNNEINTILANAGLTRSQYKVISQTGCTN